MVINALFASSVPELCTSEVCPFPLENVLGGGGGGGQLFGSSNESKYVRLLTCYNVGLM